MFVTVECLDIPDDDDNLKFMGFVFVVLCCFVCTTKNWLSALISMWKKIIEGPAPKLIRILGGTWDGK